MSLLTIVIIIAAVVLILISFVIAICAFCYELKTDYHLRRHSSADTDISDNVTGRQLHDAGDQSINHQSNPPNKSRKIKRRQKFNYHSVNNYGEQDEDEEEKKEEKEEKVDLHQQSIPTQYEIYEYDASIEMKENEMVALQIKDNDDASDYSRRRTGSLTHRRSVSRVSPI